MREYELTGTVIGRRNLADTDRIYTILTRERGLISAKARGVRNIKSKLASHLEPFSEIKLRFVRGKSLDIIIGAKIARHFDIVGAGLPAVEVASSMLLICKKLLFEDTDAQQTYDLLLECYAALAEKSSPNLVEHYFCYRYLDAIGSLPEFAFDNDKIYFNLDSGRVTNVKNSAHDVSLDERTRKLWHLMRGVDIATLTRVKNIEQMIAVAQPILASFYKYHFDVEFETKNPL